jgi:methylphosphotriester-DNA--protein-cysteine methyltransferase
LSNDQVYIPYFTGKVYHSGPAECGMMSGGVESVSKEEAEAEGLRPCQRCFDSE